jgi:hypothetical protein
VSGQDTAVAFSRSIHSPFSKSFKLVHVGLVEHAKYGLGSGKVDYGILHKSLVGGSSNVKTVIADELLGHLSWLTEVRTKRGWDSSRV